jgi:protein-S-isoprenylcysteine O-methyltransferase Ste14
MSNPEIPSRLLKKRTRHTRWLAVLLIPLIIFAAPRARPEWINDTFEVLGIFCLVVCLVGRGWSSIYIAGRKDTELVQAGPFSVVRNPLYVFSFIGLCGIGLISEMVTVLIAAVTIFVLYYCVVVAREEAYLSRLHGDAFASYLAHVPRWIPDFSKWRDISHLEVEPRRIFIHLRDSSLFFLAFMFSELLEALRAAHVLKPLFVLP